MNVIGIKWEKQELTSDFVRCPCCYKANRHKYNIETNLWIKPYTFNNRVSEYLLHFYNGIVFGNSLCCILHFCKLNYDGVRAGVVTTYLVEGVEGLKERYNKVELTNAEIEYVKNSK
jgi:hypothetical protein